MKFIVLISGLLLGLFLVSCGQNEIVESSETEIFSETEKEEKLALADSISNIAQATLLQNVGRAMKAGGPVYAVDFCNIQAVPLMDSVSKANHVKVERMTDKNRNSNNTLKTENDLSAWDKFKNTFAKSKKPVPFVVEENQTLVYYKPIAIGMPTCLKCHGAPNQDIDVATAEKIKEKYPDDLATNYKMGDFRGMWKVTLDR